MHAGSIQVRLLGVLVIGTVCSLIACGGGASPSPSTASAGTPVPPPPAAVAVVLTPGASSLLPGASQSFTATVTGSPNTAVTWEVDGVANGNTTVGTITGTGNTITYTAPASADRHTLKVISAADTSKHVSAPVTVQAAPQSGCAPAPTSSLVVSVKTYGAKGDGRTDDTAAIQAAIEVVAGTGGTLLVPDGTYMINAILNSNKGLILRSNMTLRMSSGAVLKAITNGSPGYAILYLPRVTNVNIIGGTVEGDRSTHTGTLGESGMGISVATSANVFIEGVTAKECWGDGFYVGGTNCTNITLCNVVADHNRRQGLSVVYADGVMVRNSTFKNTQGTLPEAGIDIEPNAGETVANMQILGCTFTNNSGGGIQNGVAISNRGISFIRNVIIDGNVMVGNGFNAANGHTGGGGVETSNTAGHRITNNVMRDNKNWGLRLRDEADDTIVTGNTITGTTGDGIYLDPTITNYTITGNTITGNTRYGIYQAVGSQGTLSGNTLSGNGR